MASSGIPLFTSDKSNIARALHPYFPDDQAVRKTWRPVSFSKVAFLITIFLFTGFLASTIALHLKYERSGAIMFASDGRSISDAQNFLYLYLPIILVTALGIWISVLDLDIKRLDPWCRLSGNDGDSASTLFCQYDTAFILVVIYQAVRAQHWIVASSSVLMITAVIVIPALQNSLFTTTTKSISQKSLVGVPYGIVNASVQTRTMSNSFLITAYSIAWLGQSDPPFSTASNVLTPFDHPSIKSALQDSVASTSLTRFWSEVDCWKPQAVIRNKTGKEISFDDGRGCRLNSVFSDDVHWNTSVSQVSALHIPVNSPGFTLIGDIDMSKNISSMCPEYPNRFLSVWWIAGSTPDFSNRGNGTALFCDVSFYRQPVVAKIFLSNDSVDSIHAMGPKMLLSQEEFNSTHFQNITVGGRPPNAYSMQGNNQQVMINIDEASEIDNGRRTWYLNYSTPVYPSLPSGFMVDWLVTLTQLPIHEYLNSSNLATSYDQTYQQLFALAMGHNFAPQSETQLEVEIEGLQKVVTLVPAFAYTIEALFLIALILCLFLAWQVIPRRLLLVRNPDSLAQVMDLARSATVQSKFRAYSSSTEREMKKGLQNDKFRLAMSTDGRPVLCKFNPRLHIQPSQCNRKVQPSSIAKPVLELSWKATFLALSLITSFTVLLYVLNSQAEKNNGISLPKGGTFTVQLALSFAPTIFATLLGVYINAVCRATSFLKPMEHLKRGHAKAKSTLLANFTSLPPTVLFARAFRARQYFLTLLSLLALLSNVLTVSMAGIFVQYDEVIVKGTSVVQLKEPFLDPATPQSLVLELYQDSIFTVAANASGLTKLPTWTTTEYGYLPVDLGSLNRSTQDQQIGFQSVGYGADLDCVNFLDIYPNQSAHFEFSENYTNLAFSFCYGWPSGESASCDSSMRQSSYLNNISNIPVNVVSSYELQTAVTRPNGPNDQPIWNGQENEQQIILGWLRGRWAANTTPTLEALDPQSIQGRTFEYNATVIACRPRLKTQRSVIRADMEGNIISARHLGPPDYNTSSSMNLTNSLRATISGTTRGFTANAKGWHANIIAQDWPNYLYKTILNGTGIVDPANPVPSVEFASKIASQTFGRQFVAQLFLDRQYLKNADTKSSDGMQSANLYRSVRRFRLSTPMYIITQVILTLDLIVLLINRFLLSKPFLPRQPSTIASQIAFSAASHVIDDVAAAVKGARGDPGLEVLDTQLGYRFGYGKFVGKDGRSHVGIERDPFVQKLD
ncbi:hypothetical protein BU24DRAFT_468541 [Aaosphaeria arxii CBS 175.79]|uniref:Uncharacterized protein n=1 Tax=Aaosphaeria arxii CBS 175.79 TaxID=1450172 RepID=A0A6A5X742_9PLEO|nr:uncharacterized protein BU24DRAFT_468541 [Aaosphaeria arxii CBS 175.79]KAF2008749.1 hypothetical protein BU24DRAFT_468541 [Aaosphaeria arxii CBS 175.79]